ncbi:hypothetical protein Hanom_Chr07g00604521 [Helianthus anomalus]
MYKETKTTDFRYLMDLQDPLMTPYSSRLLREVPVNSVFKKIRHFTLVNTIN